MTMASSTKPMVRVHLGFRSHIWAQICLCLHLCLWLGPAAAETRAADTGLLVLLPESDAADRARATAVAELARSGAIRLLLLSDTGPTHLDLRQPVGPEIEAQMREQGDDTVHPAELLAKATDIAKAEGAVIWYFGPCSYPAAGGMGDAFLKANQALANQWRVALTSKARVVCDEEPKGYEWQDACEQRYLRCLPIDLDALRATARALWPPWGEQILARLPGWPQRKIGDLRGDASPAPDPPPAAPVARTESDPPDAGVAAAPPTPPPSSGAVITYAPEPPADPGLPLWKIILACALLLGVAIGGWVLLRPRSRVPAMAAPTRRNGELLLLDLFSRSLVLERVRVPLGQASRSQIHPLPCEPQGRQAIVAIEVEPVAQRKDAITVNLIVDDLSDPEAPARSGQVVELTHGGEAVAFGLLRVRWAG